MKTSRPTRTWILTTVACALAIAAATFPLQASPQVAGGTPQTAGAGSGDQGRGRGTVQTAPLVATSVIVGRVIDAASGEPVAGATVNLNGGPPRSAPPQPIGRAAAPTPLPTRVLTDGQGRFAFRQLVRGNYSLSAEKIGYTGGGYGRTRPGGPTRVLQLNDNESMADVAIRIFKLVSISGRVVDDTGEPIVSANVQAYRRIWTSGQRMLAQTNQVSTDDRGMYRIHNLTPGEYIVSVPMTSTTSSMSANSPEARQNFSATQQGLYNPSPMMSGGVQVPSDGRFFWQPGGVASVITGPDGRWRAYATQYYPMAREVAQAEPIVLASGQERTGVDFTMTYLPTSTITGIIVGAPKVAANWVLRLVPTSNGEFSDDFEIASSVSDGSGAFMFAGIPSGNYVIQTVRMPPQNQGTPPPPPPPPPPAAGRGGGAVPVPLPPTGPVATQKPTEPLLWGITPVNVGEADIAGVGVAVREGFTVSGRLEFQGARARPDAARLAQIPIVIEPAKGRDQGNYGGPPPRTQADGRFSSTGKLPGRYFIRVGGAPAGWIVQSITANGVDATERPIELTQSISNVVVTFTDLIGSIRGTLRTNPPEPDPPAVLLLPADPAGWREFGMNPMRFRQTRAGANGEFNFGSLSPGDYLVVGVKEEYASEWQNPAYAEALSRVAMRVTLAAGEQRVIDINLQDVKPPGIGRPPAPIASAAATGPIAATVELPANESPDGSVQAPPAQTAPPQTPARDTRTVDPVGTGSISGQITDAAQKTPLRLARISVRGGGLIGERNAITDTEGRYIVRGLPAGDYQVIVNKPAFITAAYGARPATPTAGTTLKLAAGAAMTKIDVALVRGAVITGIIHDANGQPARLVQVQALSYTHRDGERMLTPSGSAQTDDRGMYRIFGLRPMKYIVIARPPGGPGNVDLRTQSDDEIRAAMAEAAKGTAAPASPTTRTLLAAPPDVTPPPVTAAGRSVAMAPVMYPGVMREQDAQEVVLGPSQELSGIDFRLELVGASRVSGTVIGPDGQPARNARLQLSRMVGSSITNVSVRMTPDGVFESLGVAPGTYRLIAQVPVSSAQSPAPTFVANAQGGVTPGPPVSVPREILHFAILDLDLFGNDATGLVLQTAPPLTISGRVVMAGPAADSNFRQVTVRIETVGRPNPTLSAPSAVAIDANGNFTITNVMPGRYRLAASAPSISVNGQMTPGAAQIASSINGQDALLTPFVVSDRSLTDAVVTMAAQPAEISGKLIDGGGAPVPDLFVVMFPTDPALWTMAGSRALRSGIRSQQDGTFRFQSVIPREYFVAVLTEIDQLEWGTHAYMEQLAQSAIKVNVALGEKKVQDIKLSGRAPMPVSAPAAPPSR